MPFPAKQAGGSSNAVGGSSAITIAWPAHQAGDIGILIVETANEAVTLSTNTDGFAQITSSPQGTGTGAGTTSTRLTAYWLRATSSSMNSVVVADSGDHQWGTIITFRGCIEDGNPIDVQTGDVDASGSTSVTWGALTTTLNDELVVGFCAYATSSTGNQGSGYTNASLSTITEIVDNGTAQGNGGGVFGFTGKLTVAGSTGSTTATAATSTVQGRIVFALKPAVKIAFEAIGTAVNGTGAVTPAWPTHVAGDVALLVCESDNETISLTTAAGFVEVDVSPQGTGAVGVLGTNLAVYWKRATTSSESSPTVGDPGDHVSAVIITFRGVTSNGNPWEASAGSVASITSTSISCPAVTTVNQDAMIVNIATNITDTTTAQTSAEANSNLDSMTEWFDANTNAGNGGGFAIFGGIKHAAATTGNSTATLANTSVQALITLALSSSMPGASTVTLADATSTATATSLISGTETTTLADATLVATGNVTTAGDAGVVDQILDGTTVSATATANDHGTLSSTLADATSAATGRVEAHGTLTVTLADGTSITNNTPARDGPDNVMRPLSREQWQNVGGGVPVPSFGLLFQEDTGGPCIENFYGYQMTLQTAGGGALPKMRQNLDGWISYFARIKEGETSQGIGAGNQTFWDGGRQAFVLIWYTALMAVVGSRRAAFSLAGTTQRIDLLTTNKIQMAPGSTNGGINYHDSVVHPWWIANRPGAGVLGHTSGDALFQFASDKEKVTGTYTRPGSGNRGPGCPGIGGETAPEMMTNGLWGWVGSKADAMIALGPHSVLTTMGWTVTGYS